MGSKRSKLPNVTPSRSKGNGPPFLINASVWRASAGNAATVISMTAAAIAPSSRANANGDAYPVAAGDRDRSFNYEPTFAPQASGGYMWVVFTSRRTYGTKLTNDKNSVKQLWMTAIDLHPEAGKDPSHPSFWVRGQDSNDLNMRAYWALDPCIQKGDTCKADSDCCDGSPCLDGKCGGPSTCVEVGQYCEATVDCCDPEAKCIDNSCDYDMPN